MIAFALAEMGMAGQILGVWVIIGGVIWPQMKTLRRFQLRRRH